MEISGNWRLRYQRYRFEGLKCVDCGHVSFPPRRICPVCGSENSRPMELKPEGEIYSHTIVRSPPEHFVLQAPYAVAMIRLKDGPLISAQLTDVDIDSIEIGMEVEMVTRKLKEYGKDGVIIYGYKFRPKVV
jgi:Predicted nucleic-acid-binding protein containing a Zn-ribbon